MLEIKESIEDNIIACAACDNGGMMHKITGRCIVERKGIAKMYLFNVVYYRR